jgi:hypothetical protein
MAGYESFANLMAGFASIFTMLGVIGAAVWAVLTYPHFAEARRGWPGHPTVTGCVAIRTPPGLTQQSAYVEAGAAVANQGIKDVRIDSVLFLVRAGSFTTAGKQTGTYDIEDRRIISNSLLSDLSMTVSPKSQHQILSGFTVRSEETKYYWRGFVLARPSEPAPTTFVVQVYMQGDSVPFGFGRPIWLSGDKGSCPWNAPS